MRRSNQSLREQRGIALIQVLLISSIISILAISFTYTARDQVDMARAFENRTKAAQQLLTAQSQIILKLITQKDVTNANQQQSALEDQVEGNKHRWNYYGEPFSLAIDDDSEILVSMQDTQGLLAQAFPNKRLWRRFLQYFNFNETQINQKMGVLADWQDRDHNSWVVGDNEPDSTPSGTIYPNQPIQLPQEFTWLFNGEERDFQQLKQLTTHYPTAKFNPMHAPNQLLRALFEPELAEQLITSREQGALTRGMVKNALGDLYQVETISLYRGLVIQITVLVATEGVELQGDH